jgi:hypothetical protein
MSLKKCVRRHIIRCRDNFPSAATVKILYRVKQVGSSVRNVEQTPKKWETGARQKCGQPPQAEQEVVSGNRA